MNPLATTPSTPCAAGLPGSWTLDAGRAISLRPREDGLLQVLHGRVWVTFDGPHAGPPNDLGDRVLAAGQSLRAPAGRRLVLEAADRGVPVSFDWEFAPAPLAVARPAVQRVLQPWRELRAGLAQAATATVRLLAGLAVLAWEAVGPRPADPGRALG